MDISLTDRIALAVAADEASMRRIRPRASQNILGIESTDGNFGTHEKVATEILQCFDAVGWVAGRASGL